MVIVKATRKSESGATPGDEKILTEMESRQVYEAEDFGEALTPEARASEERMRAQLAPSPRAPWGHRCSQNR